MALFVLSFQISYLTKNCNSTFLQNTKISWRNYSFWKVLFQNYLPSLTLELKISDVQLLVLVLVTCFLWVSNKVCPSKKNSSVLEAQVPHILVLFSHEYDETLAFCFFLQFCMQYGMQLKYYCRDGLLLTQLLKSFSGSVHTFPISSYTHLNKG